jgi:hypothetical protein
MQRGTCRLCRSEAELQLSHVLPAFVFRWLRESSGDSHIRQSREPNRRVQDGEKRYWLCAQCEQLLGQHEREFSIRLFRPYLESPGSIYPYSSWLLKFCVSVSWRVLLLALEESKFEDWEPEQVSRLTQAEEAWRSYLLDRTPHPGAYLQHLLPLDRIESTTRDVPANINRYLMRAVSFDLCRGRSSVFTHVKLGRFVIVGIVHEPNQTQWRGSKVHASFGHVQPRRYVVPAALGNYWSAEAGKVKSALASVSDGQQVKIDKAFRDKVEQFAGSDAFLAMKADIDMFGDEAFSEPTKASGSEP